MAGDRVVRSGMNARNWRRAVQSEKSRGSSKDGPPSLLQRLGGKGKIEEEKRKTTRGWDRGGFGEPCGAPRRISPLPHEPPPLPGTASIPSRFHYYFFSSRQAKGKGEGFKHHAAGDRIGQRAIIRVGGGCCLGPGGCACAWCLGFTLVSAEGSTVTHIHTVQPVCAEGPAAAMQQAVTRNNKSAG